MMKSIFQPHHSTHDLSFVVKEYTQPHFDSPYHFHDMYELIYIKKSHGKLYASNQVLNFSDGDMYLFGPGLSHCFYNDKSFIGTQEIAHAIVIFFKEDFLGDSFLSKPELKKIREMLDRSNAGIKLNRPEPFFDSCFLKLRKEKGMEALLILLQMLHRISVQDKPKLSHVVPESIKVPVYNYDHTKLEAVFKYVMENFKKDIRTKEAAALACMNEAAFCRYFKRRTHKTLSQFVNYVRITHATKLLVENDWSILSICYECGYNNISYFNREFKSLLGTTPFQYRKNYLELEEGDFDSSSMGIAEDFAA